MKSSNSKFFNLQKGFTLVEMMVVVAIFLVITGISILQISNYRKGSGLEGTADEIALAVRRAQTLALAVGSPSSISIPSYDTGYGVHFELAGGGDPQDADDKSFIIFVDYCNISGTPCSWDKEYFKSTNPAVDCGNPSSSTHECFEKISITSGDRITALETCTIVGGAVACNPIPLGNGLDVVFLRPSLDATFCIRPSGSGSSGTCASSGPNLQNVPFVRVTVTSQRNISKNLNIWSTGFVSIE